MIGGSSSFQLLGKKLSLNRCYKLCLLLQCRASDFPNPRVPLLRGNVPTFGGGHGERKKRKCIGQLGTFSTSLKSEGEWGSENWMYSTKHCSPNKCRWSFKIPLLLLLKFSKLVISNTKTLCMRLWGITRHIYEDQCCGAGDC